ncbi:hypothetical protein [Paenibacillus tyrfis]|uniref:hypothetical protein n=1 Tax=Paenibacillus tyrfis TaxID=1501230 RepID=UPI0020A17862|nr:hypothetical protein [Paenibacillus tyrfis]MCP1312585.1 hypothetical protein [Paenibacillus tyrfis]
MQLVFGGSLTKSELALLLEQYSSEVKGFMLAMKDEALSDRRTPYESELTWIEKLRSVALPLAAETRDIREKGRDLKMEYTKIEKNGKNYIKVVSGLIKEENDGLSLVAACSEHGTNKVMLSSCCGSGNAR